MRSLALWIATVVMASVAWTQQEPRGIRLQPEEGVSGNPLLLEWGATTPSIEGLIGRAYVPDMKRRYSATGRPALPEKPRPGLWCKPELGGCSTFGWLADFGGPKHGKEPVLLFHQDQFYGYVVRLDPERDFDFVVRTITAALGPPAKSEESEVENRMGAKFPQTVATWSTEHVDVVLQRRARTVDEGFLSITYRPLAPPKKPEEGAAPF
jgi:hypothetical protein